MTRDESSDMSALAFIPLSTWHPDFVAAIRAHYTHWQHRYGWAPVHWESMVGPTFVASKVPGACFRRAGKRVWMDSEPKLVLYRGPLARVAA